MGTRLSRGATDSELRFLLAVDRIAAGFDPVEAVAQALGEAHARMRPAGIEEPLRFAAALADGTDIHACRWASDHQPPTPHHRREAFGQLVASEPLEGDPKDWAPLRQGTALHLHANGRELRV